jgi:hypothetical protein
VDNHDVVVIGSGHNALIAAAYLARAVTLPGFRHDVYSVAHPPVRVRPNQRLTARRHGQHGHHGRDTVRSGYGLA